jgi:putative endonuclease
MFYLYILYSVKADRFYVGHTSDISKRITEHNTGKSKFTATSNDWILKYSKSYKTRLEAIELSSQLKRKKVGSISNG